MHSVLINAHEIEPGNEAPFNLDVTKIVSFFAPTRKYSGHKTVTKSSCDRKYALQLTCEKTLSWYYYHDKHCMPRPKIWSNPCSGSWRQMHALVRRVVAGLWGHVSPGNVVALRP